MESEEIPIPSDEGKGEGGFFVSHSRGYGTRLVIKAYLSSW